jgi:hypothetical protein
MPVEIRELQINVTVNQQQAASGNTPSGGATGKTSEDDQKNLINQCLEQVLDILENKKER